MPFKALGLHSQLVQATREMGFVEPTPIQAETIPIILAGRDLIATAQTGTGKTAAFLLPVLHRLMALRRGVSQALIVSPTRELAQQIDDVCLGLAYHTNLRAGLLVGGTSMGPQDKALRAGAEVIIATPGRLLDHMNQKQGYFDHLHTLVLDEADRMFDMGFLPDLKRIIARLPARKLTLLFSATMPPTIARLAQEILRNPATVQIGRQSTPAVGIKQAAYPVPQNLKTALLRHLLKHTNMASVLVFTRTKRNARTLAKTISGDGFSVAELHSNLTQSQRTRAMEGFRRGDYQVLVATNIAARGLDVDHITHVISLDVPDVPDDYVHRIGRTGRAQAEGDALVFVCSAEESSLVQIERQIGHRLPRVTVEDFDYKQRGEVKADQSRRGPRGGKPHKPGGQQHPPSHGKKPGQPGGKPPWAGGHNSSGRAPKSRLGRRGRAR